MTGALQIIFYSQVLQQQTINKKSRYALVVMENNNILWCTKRVKSDGTVATLIFYRCNAKIDRCNGIFTVITLFFTVATINIALQRLK